jgi:hypothetical protein
MLKSETNVRLIAFYLPQFHPIPENDEWWGKGFTEWTNVAKAKPLFRGHYQPHIPADLGFYDLRLPEVREAQAAMAREYGIEGFCYWHYWFAGERLLERPFDEMLKSGKPDFPFCLGWANDSWNGLWSGGDTKRILKEQTYPGEEDHKKHFEMLLPAFNDSRYLRIDGKPLFVIYKPLNIPNCRGVLDYWRNLAEKAGLAGLHFVATLNNNELGWDARAQGFDAVTVWPLVKIIRGRQYLWKARVKQFLMRMPMKWLEWRVERLWPGRDNIYDYKKILPQLTCETNVDSIFYPMLIPNWDTTPRYGHDAVVLHNSDPESFRVHVRAVLNQVIERQPDRQIIFVKSWNEWAEGNHLEPDLRFGHGYLRVIKEELASARNRAFSSLHSLTLSDEANGLERNSSLVSRSNTADDSYTPN